MGNAELLRRQYEEMVSENARLTAALAAAEARAAAAEQRAEAAVAALRDAKYTLESAQPEVGYDCECEDCEKCGLVVDECSKTDCANTCNCSTCRPCLVQGQIDDIDAVLAAAAEGQNQAAPKATPPQTT